MKKALLNDKIYFADPWRVKGTEGFVPILLKESKEVWQDGGLEFTLYGYRCEELNASRIIVSDRERLCFVFDKVHTAFPASLYTDFYIGGSLGEMSCNIADINRIVVRSGGMFYKFFRLYNCLNGESKMEKAGLMLPDKNPQNTDLKLSYYEGIHGLYNTHISLYGICGDVEQNCWAWHYKVSGSVFSAQPPEGAKECFSVSIDGGKFTVFSPGRKEIFKGDI